MAYTKIHAIKATVHKAIAYICNPAKTDNSILVTSFGCSPETAHYDFKFALSKTNQNDEKKAFHLIQSFLPGEVSYEETHQIGMEFADKLLQGKYNYVLTTHIDKGHVHNHLIFCAADNIEHKKYNDCKKTYYNLRHLSDELCQEHHLSVITPGNEHGKKHNEWDANKNNTSWKSQLKLDIDDAIQSAKIYEDFLTIMRAKGYEIKGESLEETGTKYISFRPLDKERFVRGSERSLGTDYTKERIEERITIGIQLPIKKKVSFPNRDDSKRKLIDTNHDKFRDNTGLQHWADIQNLKIAASSYRSAGSVAELEDKIHTTTATAKAAKESIVKTEHRMKEFAEIIKYVDQYQENKKYNFRYKKSKDPDTYLRSHESELLLYGGAKHMLERFGINEKSMDIEKLKGEYQKLSEQKNDFSQIYKTNEKELKKLNQELENISQYLNPSRSAKQQQNKKDEPQL